MHGSVYQAVTQVRKSGLEAGVGAHKTCHLTLSL